MGEVTGEGRTVLFVSHNLTRGAEPLPARGPLSGGSVETEGSAEEVLNAYVRGVQATAGTDLVDRHDRDGDGRLRFTSLHFESDGEVTETPVTGRDVDIVLGYESSGSKPLSNVNFSISVLTYLDEVMLYLHSETAGEALRPAPGRRRGPGHRAALPASGRAVQAQPLGRYRRRAARLGPGRRGDDGLPGRLLRDRPRAADEPPLRARRPRLGGQPRGRRPGRGDRHGRKAAVVRALANRAWRPVHLFFFRLGRRLSAGVDWVAPRAAERLFRRGTQLAYLPFRGERMPLPIRSPSTV